MTYRVSNALKSPQTVFLFKLAEIHTITGNIREDAAQASHSCALLGSKRSKSTKKWHVLPIIHSTTRLSRRSMLPIYTRQIEGATASAAGSFFPASLGRSAATCARSSVDGSTAQAQSCMIAMQCSAITAARLRSSRSTSCCAGVGFAANTAATMPASRQESMAPSIS